MAKFFTKILAVLVISIYINSNTALNLNATLDATEICALLPPGQIILNPNSCSQWVKCATTNDANDFEQMTCPDGLYFDKESKRCQFAKEVTCPFKSAQKNRCADNKDGTFLPDLKHCSAYVYCKDGREMSANCPNDLVFHPGSSSCVYKRDYNCPEPTTETNDSIICKSLQNNTILADDIDCTKYYSCENGKLLTKKCDDDLAYDHLKGACVDKDIVQCHPTAKKPEPENFICGTDDAPLVGYIADENSCSGYYYCSKQIKGRDRHPKHLECATGYFFDANMWSCRDRLNVKCNRDRCEGMDNKYVNVAGDCSAYARCNNGIVASTGNCPANYYFDERTQGCTPQKINYVACAI